MSGRCGEVLLKQSKAECSLVPDSFYFFYIAPGDLNFSYSFSGATFKVEPTFLITSKPPPLTKATKLLKVDMKGGMQNKILFCMSWQ